MCIYITAILPHRADVAAITRILEGFDRELEPLKNPHVIGQLSAGERYFVALTSSPYGCDCGTALGSEWCRDERARLEAGNDAASRFVKKCRKKGWSEAKIQRALSQKQNAGYNWQDVAEREVTEWIALIHAVLETAGTDYFGLLIHMYHGGLEEERIDLKPRERIAVTDQLDERLLSLHHDIIYEFRA